MPISLNVKEIATDIAQGNIDHLTIFKYPIAPEIVTGFSVKMPTRFLPKKLKIINAKETTIKLEITLNLNVCFNLS